jgi:plasmid stabilization system protein ParE
MARIIRAPAAESDAVEIWSYIAEDNPEAADRLIDRFDKIIRTISKQPELGRSVRLALGQVVARSKYSARIFFKCWASGLERID